jgi:hypothetical protein
MIDKRILFVTYGGGHSEIIRRLLRFFPENSYRILALTAGYENFNDEKLHGIGDVYKCLSKDHKSTVDDIINYIKSNELNIDLVWDKYTLLYYAIGALDYINGRSISELSNFHWNRHRFLQLIGMRSFLSCYNDIQLIVTTTSPRFERASLLIGKEFNIPTIQIDDLFVNPETVFLADYVIVSSSLEVHRLTSRGIDARRVFPLGNPVFEEFYKINVNLKENRKVYFCPHKDKLYDDNGIEVFHGDDKANHLREFQGLAKLLSNNPSYELIVRPHPNDRREEYLEYLDICDFVIRHPSQEGLESALRQAALWITPASTTGVQASQAGVTAISYTFRSSDIHPVWRMTKPPFIFFRDLDDLCLGLSNFQIQQRQRILDFRNDWSFLESSGKRISDFILSKFEHKS